MITENKYEAQITKNCPCKSCGRYRRFVSSIGPKGKWICTQCHFVIVDSDMKSWSKTERKLLKSGYVFKLGVKLVYKHGKVKNFD